MADPVFVKVCVVGNRDPQFELHQATETALLHAAESLRLRVETRWIPPQTLEAAPQTLLVDSDLLWVVAGERDEPMEPTLGAIRFARESNWPLLATCGGFHHVVIEYARNVLELAEAQTCTYEPLIAPMTTPLLNESKTVALDEESNIACIYQESFVDEQHYCQAQLNAPYQGVLDEGGLRVVGVDEEGEARILELPDHPFFVATLFAPQLSSSQEAPHPLVVSLLEVASRAKAPGN